MPDTVAIFRVSDVLLFEDVFNAKLYPQLTAKPATYVFTMIQLEILAAHYYSGPLCHMPISTISTSVLTYSLYIQVFIIGEKPGVELICK